MGKERNGKESRRAQDFLLFDGFCSFWRCEYQASYDFSEFIMFHVVGVFPGYFQLVFIMNTVDFITFYALCFDFMFPWITNWFIVDCLCVLKNFSHNLNSVLMIWKPLNLWYTPTRNELPNIHLPFRGRLVQRMCKRV